MSQHWEESLKFVDFNKARHEIAYFLEISKKEAKQNGGDYYYRPDLAKALESFMSNPCKKNAVKLLEISPVFYQYFEKSKVSASSANYAFQEGIDSAKLGSYKQVLARASINGIILGVAIFNPYNIFIKITIGLFGFFLYGIVASMERFKGKL